jgi:hypothetical protein
MRKERSLSAGVVLNGLALLRLAQGRYGKLALAMPLSLFRRTRMNMKRTTAPSPAQARLRKLQRQSLGDFWRRQCGGLAIYAALSLPIVAGMVGMGLDMSVWYALKRNVQGMVDAAAIGAAQEILNFGVQQCASDLTTCEAQAYQAALADAVANGFVNNGDNEFDSNCCFNVIVDNKVEMVQMFASVRAPLHFASLFVDDVFVSAFAAAGYQTLGTQCILATCLNCEDAITFGGTTTADVGCGVQSNSSHPTASILVKGQARLTANPVQAYGQIGLQGGGEIISDYPLMPNSPRIADPYSSFASSMPAKSTTCVTPGETVEPTDITYFEPTMGVGGGCVEGGAITIDGSLIIKGTANFAPGVYYIDNGNVVIESGATVTANDVAFVLTGDSPGDVGTWRIAGTADVDITASNSGDFAGMAVVQDPIAATGGSNEFVGGAGQQIDGVIYFPNQHVLFEGGNDAVGGCVQIIAYTVEFSGTSYIENDPTVCAAAGVAAGGIGGGLVAVLTQ